tara:strand:+ start:276 stop:395 length:120 start_codon:yes stop_codon:yes gene_type:complete
MKFFDLIGKLGDRIEFEAGMEIDKPTMMPYARFMTVVDS